MLYPWVVFILAIHNNPALFEILIHLSFVMEWCSFFSHLHDIHTICLTFVRVYRTVSCKLYISQKELDKEVKRKVYQVLFSILTSWDGSFFSGRFLFSSYCEAQVSFALVPVVGRTTMFSSWNRCHKNASVGNPQ